MDSGGVRSDSRAPNQFVSEIIQGKKEITWESAGQIGAALGTSAEFWLNLQISYFLWQQQNPAAQGDLNEIKIRAKLNTLAPMAVLRRRGIITAKSTADQAEQLMRFLEIDSLDTQPQWALAARRTNYNEPLTPTQKGWFACARRAARKRPPQKPLIDEDDHTLGDEDKADDLASSWVFDKPLPTLPARISAHWTNTDARDLGVHPIVVVGRLQRDGVLDWRSQLAKNAPNVTPYLKTWNPEIRLD